MFKPVRYYLALGLSLGLYLCLLVGVGILQQTLQPQGGARIAVALLPMIGALAVAWSIMRALWQMDEMQRRIQFEAMALSFLGTALVTFAWGFVEDLGLPRLSAFAVWPIMAALWVAGLFIVQQRYK